MQTTLRLPDDLYRAAKGRSAEEGISLTRFLEESIRLRLDQGRETKPDVPELRTSSNGRNLDLTNEEFRELTKQIQLEDDLRRIQRDHERSR